MLSAGIFIFVLLVIAGLAAMLLVFTPIANKYMQTPFGIVEFRDFFTGGYQNASGEDVSTGAIKEKIRKIIEAEPPTKPLSDDKISQMLAKEGFTVARRTVAKYRESLGIPGTSIRKVHQ